MIYNNIKYKMINVETCVVIIVVLVLILYVNECMKSEHYAGENIPEGSSRSISKQYSCPCEEPGDAGCSDEGFCGNFNRNYENNYARKSRTYPKSNRFLGWANDGLPNAP